MSFYKNILSFLLALFAGCITMQAQTFTIEAESATIDDGTIGIIHHAAIDATVAESGNIDVQTLTNSDNAKALRFDGFTKGMYCATYTLEVPTGQGGTYDVETYLACPSGYNRYFTFQANDDAPRVVKMDKYSTDWYTNDGRAYFQVNLEEGPNTLILGGMYGYDSETGKMTDVYESPNIDKFVFTKAAKEVTMPAATTYDEIPMVTSSFTSSSGGTTKTDTSNKFNNIPFWSLENNGKGTFTYTAPEKGVYLLNLVYGSDGLWSINVAVNGGAPQTINFLKSGKNNEAKFCRKVLVELNAGDNTITLDANASWSPWIDYMFFTRVVPENFLLGKTYTTSEGYLNIKLRGADNSDLGYFDSDFKIVTDKSKAAPLTLSKNTDGTYYIKVAGSSYGLTYNLYGVIYQDADGNYYRAGDWTTKYTTPQFQYYDAYPVSGTAVAKNKTYPRLVSYSGETDFSTSKYNLGTEVVAQNADGKDITAYKGAYAYRFCKFRIMEDGRVSFILKDNTFQNNSLPMSKTDELACGTSPYVGYGVGFSKPMYFKVLSDLNDKLQTADILYPIVDETEAVSFVIENLSFTGFEHSKGVVYDGTMGTEPDDLTYSTDYKTHDDDTKINTGVTLQRTHEYTHEVYVFPGKTYSLTPFSDFSGKTQYNEVYTRWFDYSTDTKSSRLSFSTSVYTLDKGFFGSSWLTNDRKNGAVATYTADASPTADANGNIDVIAIEAANVCTFAKNTTYDSASDEYIIKEPTLQFRHLFVIKNAKTRADEMTETETKNQNYISAHKIKLMCPAGVPFQYPLESYEPTGSGNYSDYWYKKTDGTYAQVARYRIETWEDGAKVGSTTYSSSTACKNFDTNLFYAYKNLNNQNRVLYIRQPQSGHTYTIKIFAYDGSNDICIAGTTTPIELMEYDLEVLTPENGNMITEDELTASANDALYTHQRPANMKKLYGTPSTKVDFDDISASYCTLDGSGDGYYKWPWKWENSSYAFGYDQRYDYNMYQVANRTSKVKYNAAAGSDTYDRLYQDTGGKQKGFFYYTNAASDPSRMAVLNIGKNFCQGTKVYVSAWLMECSRTIETANVVFSFRGVDGDGNETILNSFASGYVTGGNNTSTGYSDGGTNTDNRGKWMHVYYTFASENSSTFDHFIITLENNCTSSEGADYLIDDIEAYVCKPTVYAQQLSPVCNGSMSTDLKLSADFETLLKSYGVDEDTEEKNNKKSFYYCFLDKDKFDTKLSELTTAAGYSDYEKWTQNGSATEYTAAYKTAFSEALITNTYGSGAGSTANYGLMSFDAYYLGNALYDASTYNPATITKNEALRNQIGTTRNLIFPCDATDSKLYVGKEYAVAMCESNPDESTSFNITNGCARVSYFSVIFSGEVKIDGTLDSEMDGASVCANQKPVITIDLNGVGEGGVQVKTENAYFDWYYGPLYLNAEEIAQGYTAAYNTEKSSGGITLDDALYYFRYNYPSATDLSDAVTSDYTQEMKDYLQEMVDAGKLVLYQNSESLSTMQQFNDMLDPDAVKKYYITAIPVNQNPSSDVKYCLEPIQVSITISTRTPRMKNGDDSKRIPYPTTMRDVPLRIGLAQLRKPVIANLDATTADHFLYMPLRDINPATSGVTSLIQKSADTFVYLAASTDPNVAAGTSGATAITGSDLKVIGKVLDIKADIDATGNVCHLAFLKAFNFREGYTYTIKFNFEENYNLISGDHSDVCPGEVICTIKVVPEYQMWTGATDSNWNNDANWRRVTKAELLSNSAATSDYTTDGGTNDNSSSFVPADFTKVIIPANTKNPPRLYNLRTGTASTNANDASTNLTIVSYAGNPTDCDYIKNMDVNKTTAIGDATTDIKYDMSSIDLSGTDDGNVACRSWYDHTCQYIHFNSEAQMLSQQYLNYEKAWADFEMVPNKWTTISSPLEGVVAGDFYLPTASGRQDTPLFEDITFDASLHDRFNPAVFQRSWNAKDAKVVHLSGDDTNSAVSLAWSDVYNDVNVDYSSGVGFAIKPDVSMMTTKPTKVKFRLPKGDTNYYYWNPDHQDGTTKSEVVTATLDADGSRLHKLADFTAATPFEQVVGQTGATNTQYFLVGNPMMSYLNMTEFFNQNTSLEKKYWIVSGKGQRYTVFDDKTDGYVGTVDNTFIAPFQSFFVALPSASGSIFTPQFTTDMMAVKLVGESATTYSTPTDNATAGTTPSNGVKALTICATDSLGYESSVVLLNGDEDQTVGVETLFDSNLQMNGCPTLYTNKNGEAMSLTQIEQGDTIPVALTGARNEVTIKISGIGNIDLPLYLIDAETGETTKLTDDVVLQQSENGVRYYLVTGIGDESSDKLVSLPRLVADGCRLTAYAPAEEPITSLNIYTAGGALVARATNITSIYSVTLSEDIYLVEIATPTYHNTIKMYLKQ